MNKIKFEAYLRERLAILQASEIDEIVSEYLQHIELKILEGASEEEAIKDFGNLDDLVNDLLDAYKIDSKQREFKRFEYKAKRYLTESLDFINQVANSLMQKSANEIISLIVQFVLILLLIIIASSIADSIAYSLARVFYFRPYFITNVIRAIIHFTKGLIIFSISVGILYWFAKERIIEDDNDEIKTSRKRSKVEVKSTIISEQFEEDENTEVEVEIVREKSFMQSIVRLNVTILKVIAIMILIPLIIGGIALAVAYGLVIYATISGFGSIGVSLIMTGVLFIYFTIVSGLFSFVGEKRI